MSHTELPAPTISCRRNPQTGIYEAWVTGVPVIDSTIFTAADEGAAVAKARHAAKIAMAARAYGIQKFVV